MEATMQCLQGRQGSLVLSGGVGLGASGSGRRGWQGFDQDSGGRGTYQVSK